MKSMSKILLGAVLLLFLALIGAGIYLGTKTPLNDRVWDTMFSKLNTTTVQDDGTIVIHNLRNFTFGSSTIVTREWNDTTINPDDIERAYFFLDHFSPVREVGHTFVSFHLKDGSTVAFSIEARREATETYSFINGFLNEYELQYLWGTERDLVTQRTVYKNEQLYRFPLVLSQEQAQALFKGFVAETNELAATPRFYHTLTANCTNMLAKIVNKYYPGTLPYDISWNLTGLSDYYLERQGFIELSGVTPEELRSKYNLTIHRDELRENAMLSSKDFALLLENLLGPASGT
jgi:hypothetical protein